jgi:two-component system sensor histidine kinase KdpD
MADGERLTPEAALERLEAEKAPPRARLKIFLGMSAGVGKTYAMLKEASLLLERGEDVAIGWVEAHGRRETDALLAGIERIEPARVSYRGIELAEMDLDAILARHPDIALVDELAHTNAPGSRHPKRYLDVLELLDAGISVYTTVNIQHLESMAESVELVTLVPVHERVPDSVFDRADELQLVDIPPEELIKRLEEGKVYTGDASKEAVRNFFTMGNLAILREIALRQASQLASHKLIDIMRGETPRRASPLTQKILVAVSSSPNSDSLVRWARRLAYNLKAELHCINVESGAELDEADGERLQKHLDLARSLGARVESVRSADVAAGIVSFARDQAISIIVVGKSGLGKRSRLAKPTISERVVMESGEIAVFAVQERPIGEGPARRIARGLSSSPRWQYGAALLAVAAITLLCLGVAGYVGYWAASVPYLAMISLLGLVLDRKPVLLAALLSALCWDYLFIPPRFTFNIGRTEDWLMLGLYFLLASTAGLATSRLKANERMLEIREKRISLLRDLASSLAGRNGLTNILETGTSFIRAAFKGEAVILLAGEEGNLSTRCPSDTVTLDEKDDSAALYCLRNDQSSGKGTNTLPSSAWHFVPMDTPNGIIGVTGIKQEGVWTDENELFLNTIARTLSLAVEREELAEESRARALARESERISGLILDSVSHELRTPLTVIKGSASVLADPSIGSSADTQAMLVGEIQEASERLDAIVGNLLSMSRLESGPMALHRTVEEAGDLIAAAASMASRELAGHAFSTKVPDDLPSLQCDAGLVVQAIVNLLRNAASYAGPGSKIEVEVTNFDGRLAFEVRDDGPGVAGTDLPHIFDKFFRASRAIPGGTGLGLSICKAIVEAHGGSIEAGNLQPHGFSVVFAIPVGGPA